MWHFTKLDNWRRGIVNKDESARKKKKQEGRGGIGGKQVGMLEVK